LLIIILLISIGTSSFVSAQETTNISKEDRKALEQAEKDIEILERGL